MRVGPIYIDTKELFLIILVYILWTANFLGWNIPLFDDKTLTVLVTTFLFMKILFQGTNNENFLVFALVVLFASLYLNIAQVLIAVLAGFILLKLFRFV